MPVYKLSKPLRFVRYCTGEPEPVYTASATAMQMARKLDALAWKWEVSPYAMAVMPSQELFKDPDGYKRLDAYTCCHTHVNNTHIAQYGVALYRFELPAAAYAEGVMVTSVKVTVAGCPYLANGARVCVIPSSNASWRPGEQRHIRSYGTYFQAVAKRTTSTDGAYWLANTETVEVTCNRQSTPYWYVTLSLETYNQARNGYIEGAAMLVGDVEITLSTTLDGYAEGADISVAPAELESHDPAPDGTQWVPLLNYSRYDDGAFVHSDAQVVSTKYVYAYDNSVNVVSPAELSYPVLAEGVVEGIAVDLLSRGNVAEPAGDAYATDLEVSTAGEQIGILSIGPGARARFAYALRRFPGVRSIRRLRLGNAGGGVIVSAPATCSAILNVFACGATDAVAESSKVRLAAAMSLPDVMDIALASCDAMDSSGTWIEGVNPRDVLLHSHAVRYGRRDFVRQYVSAGNVVGSTVNVYAPPRVERWQHVAQVTVPAGTTLAAGVELDATWSPGADTVAMSFLAVCSVGAIDAAADLDDVSTMQVLCNLAQPWSFV